jgi:hypothetical protein
LRVLAGVLCACLLSGCIEGKPSLPSIAVQAADLSYSKHCLALGYEADSPEFKQCSKALYVQNQMLGLKIEKVSDTETSSVELRANK